MPDPSLITPLGRSMLGSLPPKVRNSQGYMAVIHAYAREIELLEASIETVRAQFNPATADVLLDAWEAELKLPVGGAGADTPTRQRAVLTRLAKVAASGTGSDWENAITEIVGYGWSYLEHDPANPASPPDGEIQITVPFASGSARWTDAVNQIRDLTDAHIEVSFGSASAFQLDVSEMDVQEFGF